MQIIEGVVTNNLDPECLGRIKFKSDKYLGGKEHPNWVDSAIVSGGLKWGVFFPPEVGESVYVIIPSEGENHTPIYFACHPTKLSEVPTQIVVGYPKKGIIKFYDLYVLFDTLLQKITVDAPLVNIGTTCTGSIGDGVVRRSDLEAVITELVSLINAKFAICKTGEGVGSISNPTILSSVTVKAGQ